MRAPRDRATLVSLIVLLIAASAVMVFLSFSPPPDSPISEITISPDVADFGTVGQGESHVAVFQVTNNRPDSLELVEVQTSCTCTIFEIEPHEVSSGGQGNIKLKWSSSSRRGETTLTATLVVKIAGELRSFPLNINAMIEPDIHVSKNELDFSNKTDVHRVTFSPGRMTDFKISNASSNCPGISITRNPSDPCSFEISLKQDFMVNLPFLSVEFSTNSKHEPVTLYMSL